MRGCLPEAKSKLTLVSGTVTVLLASLLMGATPIQASTQPTEMQGTGHYYQFVSGSYSWEQARNYANQASFNGMQGHLVSVTSQLENSFLSNLLTQYDTNHVNSWVGARDVGPVAGYQRVWQWVDGPDAGQTFARCTTNAQPEGCTSIAYTPWGVGTLNLSGRNPGQIEIYMNMDDSGWWNDCENLCGGFAGSGYIVEFEPPMPPTEMPGTGHYYQFVSGSYSWEQARNYANQASFNGMQGHLASITSQSKNDFVASITNSRSWIGARDSGHRNGTSREWKWIDGPDDGKTVTTCSDWLEAQSCLPAQLAFSNWAQGQPDNWHGQESAMEINYSGSGKWNDCAPSVDSNCYLGYIIEFEPLRPPTEMPGTGHYYQFVSGSYSWNQARELAVNSLYLGLHGHLVNITSASENEFVTELIQDKLAWIGGIDKGPTAQSARNWIWSDGPESGQVWSVCLQPSGPDCQTPSSAYSNWDPTNSQPNGQMFNESWAAMESSTFGSQSRGRWGDCLEAASGCGGMQGYIVEFEPPKSPIEPSAPQIQRVGATYKGLHVHFAVPDDDGGSPISGYQYSIDESTWSAVKLIPGVTAFKIPGLSDNRSYSVRMRACNSQGCSSPSGTSVGTTANIPGAVTIKSISTRARALIVNATIPGNYASPVLRIEYSLDGGSTWQNPVPATRVSPLKIMGLNPNTNYSVRVRAVNRVGVGEGSNLVSVTTLAR